MGHDQSLHLKVHDGNGIYWMQLAVRADTTLRQLDGFLRGMWLECCGHLSEFKIQGTRYSNLAPHPDEPDEECVACQGPARWRLLSPDSDAREPISFCGE